MKTRFTITLVLLLMVAHGLWAMTPFTTSDGKTWTTPMPAYNIRLYAEYWNDFAISYELNGGVNHVDNPVIYYEDEEITLNAPTREDYTFLGWTGSNGDTPQEVVTIPQYSTGNKTYTANWTYTPAVRDLPANNDPLHTTSYYTTFYHSTQKYQLPDDGTVAYVADLSGTDLVLTQVASGADVLPSDMAVILRAPGSNVVLTPSDDEAVTIDADNSLRGVDVVTEIADVVSGTCYVLSGNNVDGVGFFPYEAPNQLQAHKAYIDLASGSTAPRLRFVFNAAQTPTDVESVSATLGGSEKVLENGILYIYRDGVKYNAQGQRQ